MVGIPLIISSCFPSIHHGEGWISLRGSMLACITCETAFSLVAFPILVMFMCCCNQHCQNSPLHKAITLWTVSSGMYLVDFQQLPSPGWTQTVPLCPSAAVQGFQIERKLLSTSLVAIIMASWLHLHRPDKITHHVWCLTLYKHWGLLLSWL